MSDGVTNWIEPVAGFHLEPGELIVTGAHQASKLEAAGLSSEVFGEFVDPSFFIGFGIQAGIQNGISAEGSINMVSRLTQHRPAKLEQPLRSMGIVQSVTPVPRGRAVTTRALCR